MISTPGLPIKTMIGEAPTSCLKQIIFKTAGSRCVFVFSGKSSWANGNLNDIVFRNFIVVYAINTTKQIQANLVFDVIGFIIGAIFNRDVIA